MKFGITQAFDCSYLPDQKEQLLVYVDETSHINAQYEQLLRAGFRRSGEQIYRPHCKSCSACHSLRVLVQSFTPSRSQKRVQRKNAALRLETSTRTRSSYYPLYELYIEQRHRHGSMYPPSPQQFDNFIHCSWNHALFLEAWDNEKLVAVCVMDAFPSALSALYTFFDPAYEKQSIGSYMILEQIALAQRTARQYVYLGYQIDACAKMSYKQNYYPHERFYQNKWHLQVKKAD
ncbi:arginyltransferase [Alteromonas oceanisediminis]|uniref:arginyltransferase n=1 Tax=Alteromonas oceanisediminis TaxID=2836180 RepID=UPI001BDA035D|nr:arginyltransferase [Alteromonas oceanisediminis]MBT0586574.1 arginyltransferase [Alteromonas oceanisediminis]